MAHEESAELSEPGVGAFNDPSALVSSELSAVLVAPVLAAYAVRHDEVDASLGQPFAQWIRVVGAIRDHALRLVARPAPGTGNLDLGERGFRKRNFSRRGTFKPDSQRKTATAD